MECSKFERELLQYRNMLDLSSKARLHVDSCPDCRLLYQSQETILKAVADEKKVDVPPFLATRVIAGVQKWEAPVKMVPAWRQALQVTAVLVALVGGYSGSVMMDQPSSPDDFSVVLSDYFLMGDAGLTIEEGWLYSETYEN